MEDPTTDSPVASQSRRLGLFAKAWDPGKVKTRLAKTLGAEAAAKVYLELLVLHLKRFAEAADFRAIAYSPNRKATEFRFQTLTASLELQPAWQLVPQREGDLGARMSHFFQQQFNANPNARVIVIGSDTPRLSREIVDEAFELLKHHDVVFGPAADGGYYLVGLSRMSEAIFADIEWSTENVLRQSLAACAARGLSVARLQTLTDIDVEADLIQELEPPSSDDDILMHRFRENVGSILRGTVS